MLRILIGTYIVGKISAMFLTRHLSRFPFLFPFYIFLFFLNCYEISNVDHGHVDENQML